MRVLPFAVILLAAGCSYDVQYRGPKPEEEPPYRTIIKDNLATMFPASSAVRDVAISGARPVEAYLGVEWHVCMKLRATGGGGKDTNLLTYLVTIQRGEVTDRRRALASDRCDEQKFEPIGS